MEAFEVGTSLEKLTRSVFFMEVMIDNWMLEERRRVLEEEE